MDMDWTNETVLKFLELYQKHSCIWDPKDKYHKNRNHVTDAWNEIKNNMRIQCTVQQLKKKKESLMAAYRGYKCKIKKSVTSGEVYRPTWYAFTLMDSFLGSVYEFNRTHTENEPNPEEHTSSELDENGMDDGNDDLKPSPQQINSKREFSSSINKRRSHDPPELERAKTLMNQAFDIMKNIFQEQQCKDEDDECNLFARLLAKRLRKLPEERRDLLIYKINNLVYEDLTTLSIIDPILL